MYYLTRIVKPCPSTLRSLRAHANKNAIIWLSVLITTSENDSQAPQTLAPVHPEVEQGPGDNTEASPVSTSDLSISKSQESVLSNSKFRRTGTDSINTDPTDTKTRRDTDADMCIPSYLSASTTEQSSNGAVVTVHEDLNSRASTTCEPTKLQDYSFPHYKSAALLERLNFVTNSSDRTPTTPTNRKLLGCPSTAEKLKIAMNGPDLPATPTLVSKREITHLDLQESLTPEEEYFITNYELKKLDNIINTVKEHLIKGAAVSQQPQTQTSLNSDYITMACYNIELTASYYYKRFFLTGSVHDYDTFYILLACVLLAAKVSGVPRTLNCTKPSFFAKLFVSPTAQETDYFEKILKNTEEWVYMRLGYDLCTTSLLDLFVCEGYQLFFAITDDGGDISLASDDSSIKKSSGAPELATITDTETPLLAAYCGLEPQDNDRAQGIKPLESLQEGQQRLDCVCTAPDLDLHVSSLTTVPPTTAYNASHGRVHKSRMCKVGSTSPIFESQGRAEPSSPSAVAFLGRDCSQLGGGSPHRWAALNTNCVPISSALCSPTKPVSPYTNLQFHHQKRLCPSYANARPSLINSAATNTAKDTTEPTSLFFSSTSERESKRGREGLDQQAPVHAVHTRVISETNMNISDLNMSNSVDTQLNESHADYISLPTFVPLKAVKFARFLHTTKRSKSTGAIQLWETESSTPSARLARTQSFYFSLASSAISLSSDAAFIYDSKDQHLPFGRWSSKNRAIHAPLSLVMDTFPLDSNRFEENLSGVIRNKPLLNIYNKDTLTIASSHTKPPLDDMLAPHIHLHQIHSDRKANFPCTVASVTPLQPPKDPSLAVRFAKEVTVHSVGDHLECEEVLCGGPSTRASVHPQKISKRIHRRKDRAVPFLLCPTGSPVSSGKALPDGALLSPQAIQYVAPEQVMQKWAPSRSASLRLQDSNRSTLPVYAAPPPPTDHVTYYDCSTEYGTDSTLSSSVCKIVSSSHGATRASAEDILLEIPTPRVEDSVRDPAPKITSSIRKTHSLHTLYSPVHKLLRISSMLMPADYTLLSVSSSKRWLKRLADARSGIKTASYLCKHSYNSPVHISSTLKMSRSSSLVGFVMLRHIHKRAVNKATARFSRDFLWQVFSNPVLLTVQVRSLSPISYIEKLAMARKKYNLKKVESKARRTVSATRKSHDDNTLLESPSSDYQHESSDATSVQPENDTPNTLVTTSVHTIQPSNQVNTTTDKSNPLTDPPQDSNDLGKDSDVPHTSVHNGARDTKDWSSISEQMYKLSLTSYQNASLSGDFRVHADSFNASNVSSQNKLLDIHCQCEAFPCHLPPHFRSNNQCAQPMHTKMPTFSYPSALHKTLTFHNISTVSAVLQDQSFSDDHYIKKMISSKAKTKLQELVSIEFSLVMQYILSTPSIMDYLVDSCGLVQFERTYQLAHSTLQHRLQSMACFGSVQEKKRASQLTPDNISMLSFIFAASYAYSMCFKYTDMLLLFSNASISVFLMAESLLLLYNKILPHVLAHTEGICNECGQHTLHNGSQDLPTMSPANLPLHPVRSNISSTSKSEQTHSSTIKSNILTLSFGGPQIIKKSKHEPVSDCNLEDESPSNTASSLSASSSLKSSEKQILSAEAVHKILSARSRSPIFRASLYNSIVSYQEPQNTDIPIADAFVFRMGGQQHSMISAEDASQRLGPLSAQASFDGSQSMLSSKKDTSDDLYNIMRAALFVIDTYPHHKKLRTHQQSLSTTLCDLKKKHFGFMYTTLKQPCSSEPISIKQYMAGINKIFELMQTHVLPRLKSCQYFIKQPGTVFHDIRYWQMVLKLDLDKKRYRELRSMLTGASEEQKISIKQRMDDISTKWNIAEDSYWDESDSY